MLHSSTDNRRGHFQIAVLLAALVLLPVAYGSDMKSGGIVVELSHVNHLSLLITLRSGAEKTSKITRDKLPWSAGHRMSIVVAVDGRCLKRDLPVDDPMFDEIALEPGTPLTGEINLEALFPDINRVLKDRDLQLFWAYEAPEELNIPRWSGGWILIPQKK